jgi:flagellar motor switch protein FliN/FliY
MTINPTAAKTYQAFSSDFFKSLVEALTEASGSPWVITSGPDVVSATDRPDPVCTRLKLEGSLRGEFVLEFDREEAAMLASQLLRRPAGESGIDDSEALLRLIKSGLSDFRSALTKSYGVFEVDAAEGAEPPSDPAYSAQISATDDNSNRISIVMYLNKELTEALQVDSTVGNLEESNDNEAAGKVVAGEVIPPQVNLNLVMDVELNVTLRFGRRQLTLREVLELTSGSVVELDRQVEEPVELLLDGQVIAKGEAVVIDGNYGFRVTEVLKPVYPSLVG